MNPAARTGERSAPHSASLSTKNELTPSKFGGVGLPCRTHGGCFRSSRFGLMPFLKPEPALIALAPEWQTAGPRSPRVHVSRRQNMLKSASRRKKLGSNDSFHLSASVYCFMPSLWRWTSSWFPIIRLLERAAVPPVCRARLHSRARSHSLFSCPPSSRGVCPAVHLRAKALPIIRRSRSNLRRKSCSSHLSP